MSSLLTLARAGATVDPAALAGAAHDFHPRAGDGAVRREVFAYHDLALHVREFDGPAPVGPDPFLAGVLPGCELPRGDAYYGWTAPGFAPGGLVTTVIVNRMHERHRAEVERLFADLDATDFPLRMGTRRRQVLASGDLYFHTQDFARADGAEVIDHAWQESDPRFVRICEALMRIIPPYDVATWTTPADSLAECVFAAEAPAPASVGR